jgi:hypothetical protein
VKKDGKMDKKDLLTGESTLVRFEQGPNPTFRQKNALSAFPWVANMRSMACSLSDTFSFREVSAVDTTKVWKSTVSVNARGSKLAAPGIGIYFVGQQTSKRCIHLHHHQQRFHQTVCALVSRSGFNDLLPVTLSFLSAIEWLFQFLHLGRL